MELSPAIESSITSDCSEGNDRSIVDEAFNGKISAFDQYHSSEHGAHSHIESIDTARSSGFSVSQRAIASQNASRDSKSSGSGDSGCD
jgi:hypothetical protein